MVGVFGNAQWLFALGAVARPRLAGGAGGLGWLRLPEIETPRLGPLPYPLLLLAAGCCSGCCWRHSPGPGAGGRPATCRVIEHRLRESVSGVASEHIVAPVREVLRRHAATREQLDRARA